MIQIHEYRGVIFTIEWWDDPAWLVYVEPNEYGVIRRLKECKSLSIVVRDCKNWIRRNINGSRSDT